MTRARVAVLVAVLVLTAGALYLGVRSGGGAPKASGSPRPDAASALVRLRTEAALTPCPSAISPALPKLTLACLGGGPPVAIQGAPRGVPSLVNVYGSWCHPCFKEMPLLAAFSRASAGRVSLLGVDTEDDPTMALRFAKDVGQTWNAVIDDDGVVMRKYASGPPVTLFVDGTGAVVHAKIGAFKDLAELKALTAQYLKVSV